MKPGTQIRLPDGREGTVVFHGLTGYGIVWGLQDFNPDDFGGTHGDVIGPTCNGPVRIPEPEAMLRKPEMAERLGIECVGEDYTAIAATSGEGDDDETS